MKHALLLIALLLSISFLIATEVSGNQSGIWTLANSPYQVIGAVTVPAGSNLNIEPGVLVQIMGSYQITVAGTLTANGTVADSIRFVKNNPPTLWPGLRFENTSQNSSLQHVYIEYATYGVRSINSPLTIDHCRFNLCEKGMDLYAIGSANPAVVMVQNSIIENCIQNGILISQNSNAQIQNNDIRHNGTGAQFRAAIQLSNQSAGGSNDPIITGNHIHHNLKQGISAWDVASSGAINPTITNNIIEYNYTGIYLLQASGYVADNQINYNFIPGDMNSGAGVMVSGVTSHPYFERNTVIGNYTGFYITNNAMPVLGDLSENHIWAQGENIIRDNIDVNNALHSVFCDAYANSGNTIKAENNDWGAYSLAEIAVGINDHSDNAALPTVDYDPFYVPIIPQTIIGVYTYTGSHTISEARLELVGTASGEVLQSTVLPSADFSVQVPINDSFFAQVVLTDSNGDNYLYGIAGGYLNPTVFIPTDVAPIQVGNIEVTDIAPPEYELMAEPYSEGGLVLHPLMRGFGVYSWNKINWLYAAGDYLYLKRHWIRGTPDTVIELPANTIWKKYQHIHSGDTWQQTEVMDVSGTLRVSTVSVQNCTTFPEEPEYTLFTRKDSQNHVIDKIIQTPQESTIFRYDNDFVIKKQEILRFGDPDPLAQGALWLFMPQTPELHPTYLGFDPEIFDANPAPWDVKLFWQAPAPGQTPWTHYRIYRNDVVIAEIPFSQSEYTDATFDPSLTGTTNYWVKAWDGNTESAATNFVCVIIVDNQDELAKPVIFSIYPNPVAISENQQLQIKADNLGENTAKLEIYNLKGQKVHSAALRTESVYQWNGRDEHGLRCAAGVYFLRVKTPDTKTLSKKIIIR